MVTPAAVVCSRIFTDIWLFPISVIIPFRNPSAAAVVPDPAITLPSIVWVTPIPTASAEDTTAFAPKSSTVVIGPSLFVVGLDSETIPTLGMAVTVVPSGMCA